MRLLIFLACLAAFAYAKKEDEEASMDIIFKVNNKKSGKSKFGASLPGPNLREGDIVETPKLKRYLKNERENKSNFDAIVNGAWPGAVVYYSTNRLPSAGRTAVSQAIAEYHAKTCIRFRRRTNQRAYLDFFQGGGCYSMIGRQGGRQDVSLGRGCETKGVTIHEIMHALGFFHEQSRRDRDRYVTIHWANIPQRVRYNFETYKHGQANTLGEGYDKRSVMHYGSYAFSSNGRRTISSKTNPGEQLGQRSGLSDTDVKQLRKYYKCSGTTTTTTDAPTTSTTCKDTYSLCGKMAQVGLCTVGVAWVPNNCKKSCKKCPTRPSMKACKYHKNRGYCGSWKSKGFCTNRTYRGWMEQHCSVCGKCK